MAGQRVQQFGLVRAQVHIAAEEQVHLAQHALLQPHGHAHQVAVARPRAVADRLGTVVVDGDDPGASIRAQAAAGAGARQQAALVLLHLCRKAVGRQHQVALVHLVGPAHHHSVGLHHHAHALRKTVGQLFDRAGPRQEGADLVQGLQPGPLRFDPLGFIHHLGFQPLVHGLQGQRHVVEAGGHLAELVLRVHVHPGREIPRLELAQSLAQVVQRMDHIHVPRIDHHDRANDGQRHHGELKKIQKRGQAGQLHFDGQHEPVDGLDKVLRGHLRRPPALHGPDGPHRPLGGPDGLHRLEAAADLLVPGHKQGSRGVTFAQKHKTLVERVDEALDLLRGQFGLHRAAQAPGLHAHAARFIDRCGAALQVPGDPQGQADGRHGDQQETGAQGKELGLQGRLVAHPRSVGARGLPRSQRAVHTELAWGDAPQTLFFQAWLVPPTPFGLWAGNAPRVGAAGSGRHRGRLRVRAGSLCTTALARTPANPAACGCRALR